MRGVLSQFVPDDVDARLTDPAMDAPAQTACIRRFLNGIDAAELVCTLADRVATDDALADRIGANAVEHPNGFDLINIAGALPSLRELPPYRVRLHVWWPERRRALEDIHNHAWDFSSLVLIGHLRFLTYSRDADGQRYHWYRYRLGSDTGNLRATPLGYADLDAEPSPSPAGPAPVMPYESMRGCPFRCKFCSFPAASPQWRYKTASKIRDDFARYHNENGTEFVKALDSTFTVPPRRLREVLPLLADLGLRWEAYTRANALRDARTVEALSAGHCASLAIGFESMSDAVLGFMNKQVTASANRTAFRLLQDTEIDYRASFMVGYPGETPEHHEETRRFLAEEYRGRFSMYVFSLSDETMPVWQDAERFGLRVLDEDRPDEAWTHVGVDHAIARRLQRDTLREVRWRNDNAVLNLWQGAYEMPLAPTRSEAENLRIEKLIERLGMLCVDVRDETETARRTVAVIRALRALGVDQAQPGDVRHGPRIPTNG